MSDDVKLQGLEHWAWTIIAYVNRGDWSQQSQEWQDGAIQWRDAYYRSFVGGPPEHTTEMIMESDSYSQRVVRKWSDKRSTNMVELPLERVRELRDAEAECERLRAALLFVFRVAEEATLHAFVEERLSAISEACATALGGDHGT